MSATGCSVFFRNLSFASFYTIKTLWGSLSDANKALNFKPGYDFETLDGRTYLELGTGIDNIFKVLRLDFYLAGITNSPP
jgi:hypothetical protein